MSVALRQADLFAPPAPRLPEGIALLRAEIGLDESRAMLDAVLGVLAAAPPYRLKMKTGAYVINRMTNCGAIGWHSDDRGYRYVARHPELGTVWPAIPPTIADRARMAAEQCGIFGFEADACLVNLYGADGKLNLHQDRDEADFAWPIVSFSFGNDAVFALGGSRRKDPVEPVLLRHGDVLVMHGPGRLRFHGVKKIVPESAPFAHGAIPDGGRLNLTLRRAA